jgi:hypothetical protein
MISGARIVTLALIPAFSPGEKENHLPLLDKTRSMVFPSFSWKSFRQTAIATRVIEDSIGVIHVHPLLGGEGRGEGEPHSQCSFPPKIARNPINFIVL